MTGAANGSDNLGLGAAGPSRKTLLYLHGLGETKDCWSQVIGEPRLSRFDHWALDLSGYGGLADPQGPCPIARHAAQVVHQIEASRRQDVTVVGHSMGGVIGTWVSESSSAVRAFVNVEGNLSPGDCTESAIAARRTPEEFRSTGFDELIAALDRRAESDSAYRGYSRRCRKSDPDTFHLNACELVELSASRRLIDDLRSVSRKIPTLFVAGFPRGLAAESYDRLFENDIPLKMLYPSGHWPYVDRFDEFVEAIGEFMENEGASCEIR